MWKLGNLYTPVSQTLDSWTPFSRISPISRKITHVTCSLLKTAPYTRKYHFSDTAQNTGGKKGVLLDWRENEKEEEEWLVQYIKLST
jgi:hypothetical protein